MAVKEILGKKKSKSKSGFSATKVSGYVDTPVPKRCGTCEYLILGNRCRKKEVLEDPEIKTVERGLKEVSPENGCCDYWIPKTK